MSDFSASLAEGAAVRAGTVRRGLPHQRQPDRRQELPRTRPRQGPVHWT